jgi:hypothetical protein
MAKGSWIIIKVDTQADNSANGTQVTSTATVSTSTSDPVSGNNSLSTMLMFVDLRPDLNIRAVYDNPVLVPGTSTKLRIQVANGGSIGSSGPTTVTFALPSGLSLVNGDSVPATCSASGANVTCSSASGLAIPGGLVEFVLPVSLIESATPGNSLSLTATAGTATTTDSNASGNESNTSNNAVTVALTVGPATVDLAVTATRPPKTDAGATAVVLMTITNNGPSDSAGGYSLRYDLPQKVSLSGALPSGCAQSGASITCTRGTAFAKAATDTYSITVIVDSATLSGLTIGGAIEVTTQAVESALSNNAVTVTAANLDVNGLTPPTTTTTTSTTTTTVAPTTTVPKPVKKKAIPDTGFSTNDFLVASMWAVLLGAFLVDLSRRRRLRQI